MILADDSEPPILWIRDYRKRHDTWIKNGRMCFDCDDYGIDGIDLGDANRLYGCICNKCMDNIVLRALGKKSIKMESQLQRIFI